MCIYARIAWLATAWSCRGDLKAASFIYFVVDTLYLHMYNCARKRECNMTAKELSLALKDQRSDLMKAPVLIVIDKKLFTVDDVDDNGHNVFLDVVAHEPVSSDDRFVVAKHAVYLKIDREFKKGAEANEVKQNVNAAKDYAELYDAIISFGDCDSSEAEFVVDAVIEYYSRK